MQTGTEKKHRFISIDINEAALLRILQRCDVHASDLHCRSQKQKDQLQQLLLKAACQTKV